MDLDFGPQYDEFRKEVQAFLAANWPDKTGLDKKEAIKAFRRTATEAGYLYRNIPKIYGGSEQAIDPLKGTIIREEFAKAGAPREIDAVGVTMLTPTLLACAEEWQREKFIPPTLLGEIFWCQGYSEPNSGSDLASLRTRAVLEGDEWVINGQKVWTSRAKEATHMFVLVRTEPDAPKHQGISYLLVDIRQPGVTIRPLKQITGGSDFNEVFLDNVRTPKDWIVGNRGEGWQVSRSTLKAERNVVGNSSQTETLHRKLVQLAGKLERDGEAALKRDDVRQDLAKIEAYILAHKYSSYRQMSMDLAGQDAGMIVMLNKLNGTNIGIKIANLVQDLLGSDGMLMPGEMGGRDRGNEKWTFQIMGSLGMTIAGGASNIQRNIIAERGLGLPRGEGDKA